MSFQQGLGKITPVLAETYVDPVEPVDTSDADTIRAVGKGIVETYSGIQQGELREDITGITQDYITSHAQKNLAASSLPDAVVNKAHLEQQTAEDEEEARFFNDPVVNKARQEVNRLANAVEAGVMSDTQLKIRVQAKMREYINRAPGLGQHFRRLTSEVLGDYDAVLDGIAANSKAQAKQGDFIRKKVYAQASTNHIDLTQPYEQVVVQNNDINEGLRLGAAAEQQKSLLKDNRAIQGDAVRKGLSNWMSKELIVSAGLAKDIELNTDFDTPEAKIHQLELARIAFKGRANAYGEDFVESERMSSTSKVVDDLFKEYITAVGEGRKLETLDNQRKVTELLIQNEYFKKNPGLEKATALLKTIPAELLQFSEEAMFLTTNIVKAINNTAFGVEGMTKKDLDNYYKYAKGSLSKLATDPDSIIQADDLQKILMGPILNFDKAKVSNETMEHISKFMARDEAKKFVGKLSEDVKAGTISELSTMFDSYLEKRWMPNLMKDVASSIGTQLGFRSVITFQGLKGREDISKYVKSSISPAGALRFEVADTSTLSGRDKDIVQEELIRLNRMYAGRFNQLVKAKAHLTDGTYPEVATSYYNQYFVTPPKKEEE